MKYNEALLKSWCKMPDWGDYLDQHGGVNKFSSKEGFDFLSRKYYRVVKKRINYCNELLEKRKDAFLYYVTAELFNRCNEDESPAHLYKRHVRYYALKALGIDSEFTPAKTLLNKVDEWIEFIDGEKDSMPNFEV